MISRIPLDLVVDSISLHASACSGEGFFYVSQRGRAIEHLAPCFLKDLRGTALPDLLKKTFDMVELFETKLLLLLPRYPGHGESMVGHLKLHRVRDHAVARGGRR